jgi:hypothetical protein
MKHLNTFHGLNVEVLNVRAVGTSSYHLYLKAEFTRIGLAFCNSAFYVARSTTLEEAAENTCGCFPR